jgi:tetratricopeptide (TPR) repeat protein
MAETSEPTSTAEQSAAATRPGRADCLEQLDRLVRRGALSPEARGYLLLAYLIEHYLEAGVDAPVKAYAIAVDVLGRSDDFDPAQDSIVRVEIGRLRKLLEMYYLGPGQEDPVRIELPRGQSHLNVAFAAAPPRDAIEAARPAPGPAVPVKDWRRAKWLLAGLAAMVVTAVILALLWREPGDAEIAAALDDDYPRVFVRPFSKDPGLTEAFPGNAISSFVATELAAFRSFRVIAPQPATTLPVRPRDYVLEGTVKTVPEAVTGDIFLTLQLRDGVGTVLWTDQLSFPASDPGPSQPVFAAMSDIASRLGGALGVIDSVGRARLNDEEREWASGNTSDFRCILRWQTFDLTKDPQEREAARACLSDRAEQDTPVGQIWSALAFLMFLDWTEAGARPDDPLIDKALAAANRALLLDPEGPDGHEALGSILTGLGRIDEAQEVLARALEINPSNLDTAVKLGWIDCLNGDWETGTERIRQVIGRYTAVPGWYRLPLALAAFRSGNGPGMFAEAKAILASGDRRGLVLAVIAARMASDRAEELRHLKAIEASGLTLDQALVAIEAVFPDVDLVAAFREVQ